MDDIVQRLHRAGFNLGVVEASDTRKDIVVLMMKPRNVALNRAWVELQRARWMRPESGVSQARVKHLHQMTLADRLQVQGRMIELSAEHGGADFPNFEHVKVHPNVAVIFPLSDRVFAAQFLKEWWRRLLHTIRPGQPDLLNMAAQTHDRLRSMPGALKTKGKEIGRGAVDAVSGVASDLAALKVGRATNRVMGTIDGAVGSAASPGVDELGKVWKRFEGRDKWFVDELRHRYGDEVAFYFAFTTFYTTALCPLAVFGLLYQLSVYFLDYTTYLRWLAVLSIFVVAIYAPMFLKLWKQRSISLSVEWESHDLEEIPYENPFKSEEPVGGDHVKARSSLLLERVVIYGAQVGCVLFGLLGLFAMTAFFVQLYVTAKVIPVCGSEAYNSTVAASNTTATTSEEKWWSWDCVDTEFPEILYHGRWIPVVFVCAMAGIMLDLVFTSLFEWVATVFTKLENRSLESTYTKSLVTKQFAFNWISYFGWFLLLSLVYVPFGNTVHKLLREYIGDWAVGGEHSKWDDDAIAIDEMFIIPLVVSQASMLIFETFVPYIQRKLAMRVRRKQLLINKRLRENKGLATAMQRFNRLDKLGVVANLGKAAHLGLSGAKAVTGAAGAVANAVTGRNHRSTAGTARDSIGTLPQDCQMSLNDPEYWIERLTRRTQTQIKFVDKWAGLEEDADIAAEIYEEGSREKLVLTAEYLDLVIQFGYILMFTGIWPLAPLMGVINNLFEIIGDAFKMMLDCRMSVPHRSSSIGLWEHCLLVETLLAVPVVAFQIVVTTGQAEAWGEALDYDNCGSNGTMRPNWNCSAFCSGECEAEVLSEERLALWVGLEHIALFLLGITWLAVAERPEWVSMQIEAKTEQHKHELTASLKHWAGGGRKLSAVGHFVHSVDHRHQAFGGSSSAPEAPLQSVQSGVVAAP